MKQISDLYIFYGNGSSYTKAAWFRFDTLIKSTKQYKEAMLAKNHNKMATYQLKIAEANDLIHNRIEKYAQSQDTYDLIVNKKEEGFDDITDLLIPLVSQKFLMDKYIPTRSIYHERSITNFSKRIFLE